MDMIFDLKWVYLIGNVALLNAYAFKALSVLIWSARLDCQYHDKLFKYSFIAYNEASGPYVMSVFEII